MIGKNKNTGMRQRFAKSKNSRRALQQLLLKTPRRIHNRLKVLHRLNHSLTLIRRRIPDVHCQMHLLVKIICSPALVKLVKTFLFLQVRSTR